MTTKDAALTRAGTILFALGLVGFGTINFLIGNFLPELQPLDAQFPERALAAYLYGAVLIVMAILMLLGRRVHLAACVVAVVFALTFVAMHGPILVADPMNGGRWTSALEVFAAGAGALMLVTLTRHHDAPLATFARLAFAITLPAFGALHFIYRDYVASVIPGFLPGHMFWAYATGIAHIAAGLSLLTNIASRLAALLLAVMFGSWVILLHVPRVLAAFHNRAEWTSLCVAVTLCGAALLIAAGVSRKN
jgi:uncharacterized membrane protein